MLLLLETYNSIHPLLLSLSLSLFQKCIFSHFLFPYVLFHGYPLDQKGVLSPNNGPPSSVHSLFKCRVKKKKSVRLHPSSQRHVTTRLAARGWNGRWGWDDF
ncbi:hypothetical protein CEXT_324391 [Caerostris extrusa]|uniref:Uncharacterized protein n=1 Tax=Caerostris extrusa TaxID=172846 RepID=A0AAV4UT71_CAEEX|nr:hypothetical protein CEXT_324391 [Caerostris extrusa]